MIKATTTRKNNRRYIRLYMEGKHMWRMKMIAFFVKPQCGVYYSSARDITFIEWPHQKQD